jgi:hypothetical protein
MALPLWMQQRLLGGTGGIAGGGTYPPWATPPFNPNQPLPMPQSPQATRGVPMASVGGPRPGGSGGFNPNYQPPMNQHAQMPSRPVMPPSAGTGPKWLQKVSTGLDKVMGAMAGPTNPNLSPQDQAAQRAYQMRMMAGTLLRGSGPRPQGTQGALEPFGNAMIAGQAAGQEFGNDAIKTQFLQAQMAQAQAAAAQQPQGPSYASPIGKMLGDRDLAAQRNDTAAIAAIDQAIAKDVGISGDQLAKVLQVRDDMTRNSGGFLEAQTGFEKVMAASQTDSPAGDMSMIFGFMKVLDPGSIVKEGEFATVQNSAGIPEQIRGTYNRIIRGERLTPEQRADFAYQARQQFEPMVERQQRLVDDAKSFAERNNLPFADIVPEYLHPFLPAAAERPTPSDPGAQLPGLWNQIKDDVSGLFKGFKSPAEMSDEEIAAELAGLQDAGPR